jgi:KDO2-lipid IV(A) lauroyltransferase
MVLAKIPKPILYYISDILFFILFYLIKYRRKTVHKNLRNSFPHKSDKEIKLITKKFYRHLCDLTIESAALIKMSNKKVLSYVNMENPEIFEEYYKNNRNVILVFAHYGNWEILSPLPLHTRYPFLPVYKSVKNEYIDKGFYKMRSLFGAIPVKMEDTLQETLKYYKANKPMILGLIADQTPAKRYTKYFTDFLNQETAVFFGPERIGKKINAVIIYANIIKEKRGLYKIKFSLLCDNPNERKDYEITNLFNSKLEKIINEKPEFWLWSHNRWKRKRKEKHIYLGDVK